MAATLKSRIRGTDSVPVGRTVGAALAVVAATGLSRRHRTACIRRSGCRTCRSTCVAMGFRACSWCCSAPSLRGISIFAAGYFRRGEGTAPGLLCLQYHLFLASMGFVLLADDAYAFMLAWETMALSSYFLVTTQHRLPEIRKAGFLYLLMAHLGRDRHSPELSASFRAAAGISPSTRCVRAPGHQLGGGCVLSCAARIWRQGGLVPLHVWLPEAHPAAPSPVSALMSGVMLEWRCMGLIRVSFDLLLGRPFGGGVCCRSPSDCSARCTAWYSPRLRPT